MESLKEACKILAIAQEDCFETGASSEIVFKLFRARMYLYKQIAELEGNEFVW